MNKSKILAEKLKAFGTAWAELSQLWCDINNEEEFILEDGYPFNRSFDELGTDVIKWTRKATSKLEK